MVDFSKLMGGSSEPKSIEPRELFSSLVRAEHLPYLRDVQASTLEGWYAKRDQKDSVIKMNTGSGKTIVGLLMLQSSLNEGVGPALYLCPTSQLAGQVVAQAKDLGIAVAEFAEGSKSIPIDFLNSEAILVTNINRLVNGRSLFGVMGYREPVEIGAILVDDAHTCLARAREAVTIELPKGSVPYKLLLAMFEETLISLSAATGASIMNGDPTAWMAIPHWTWQSSVRQVAKVLAEHSDSSELNQLKFAWNLVKDELTACTCVVSGSRIVIAPWAVPIHRIPAFTSASRRFFLSATLADDSVLIRDFGVARASVQGAISPPPLGDIGERMIIAPALIDQSLNREKVAELAKGIADAGFNVVVLVPSFKYAEFWTKAGAQLAEGRSLELLQNLRETKGNFVVLANRYDGIDLPSDQCRVLILDGQPQGGTLYDQYLGTVLPKSRTTKAAIAQRLEQGMGRGVRSGNDYCVVLVVDDEIVRMLTVKTNQQFFTPETRRQLEIESELRKLALAEGNKPLTVLKSLVWQCLSQDRGWKAFHRSKMRDFAKPVDAEQPRRLAELEYNVMIKFRRGDSAAAAEHLETEINKPEFNLQPEDQGWYFQLASALWNPTDPVKAQDKQRKAHELNSNLFRPVAGTRYQKLVAKAGTQASRIINFLADYTDSNALVLTINGILAKLTFGSDADEFEAALDELGRTLGFESHRPEHEYGRGPDVLWALTDGHYLIIEAKNEVLLSRETVSKSEASQLSNSVNWFREEYPPEASFTPVLVHPSERSAADAYAPPGTVVLGAAQLGELVEKVRNFASALAKKSPETWKVEEVSALLAGHDLIPGSIRSKFVRTLK